MILPISLLVVSASARLLNLPYSPSDSLEDVSCYKYACKPENITFSDDTCSYYNSDDKTYYVSPCTNSTMTCDLGSYNSTCTMPTPDPTPSYNSYPGEPCLDQGDCVYGECDGTRCVGSKKGGACVNNYECDPGFKCNGSNCDEQIAVGSTGCRVDEDCVSYAACNIVDTIGTCIEYFSVEVGQDVSDCHVFQHISDICASGWCEQESQFTNKGKCVNAPVSYDIAPLKCTKDADCYGLLEETVYDGECKCGYNSQAQGYCSPFIGDEAGINIINSLNYFVRSGALAKCNTARRFEQACWEISKDTREYANVIKAGFYYEKYPELQDNTDCIKQTWTDYYWGNAMGLLVALYTLLL